MGSLHTNLGCGHVGASSSVTIKQEKLDDKEIMEKKKNDLITQVVANIKTALLKWQGRQLELREVSVKGDNAQNELAEKLLSKTKLLQSKVDVICKILAKLVGKTEAEIDRDEAGKLVNKMLKADGEWDKVHQGAIQFGYVTSTKPSKKRKTDANESI